MTTSRLAGTGQAGPRTPAPRPGRTAAGRGAAARLPTLATEASLLAAGAVTVAGMDEVGRGSLAGPVSVGVVVVDASVTEVPEGLADSKLLSPHRRTGLLPRIAPWCLGHAVGHAEPEEIDAHGIVAALRLAGTRALAGLGRPVDVVLLDGRHDWLTSPGAMATEQVPVLTMVKADLACASVAAASVLAKCERDAMMTALAADYPDYDWAANKGYGSPTHLAALRRLGPSPLHRRSWRLPGGGHDQDPGGGPRPGQPPLG